MDLGRVFISSVFGGMLDLRQLAADAARLVGLEPILTELHAAQAGNVRDALSREIEHCDTYVGLFDTRRGTVPASGTDARAITEEEFRLAREKGLRRLVFISDIDSADRDPELKAFLDREVSEYSSGVWARSYKDEASLAREIAAALSVLRPRVVLTLSGGEGNLEARLHLEGVKPAWTGEAVLGPVPVNLSLDAYLEDVFRAFFSWNRRNQLPEDSLRAAGAELAKRAFPGPLGEALEAVLDKAAHASRLVTLEIRTEDQNALARPWELLSFPKHPLPVRQGLIEIVRHIPSPGEDPDPLKDPAPEIPAKRISVLGFTAAPLEDQSVVALPGTGGMRDSELFWEREQENLLAALDRLVLEGRGRLILPDTGDKEELRSQLGKANRPQVVHLSCHGGTDNGKPSLFLEDAEGHRSPLGAEELLAWLRARPKAEPLDLLVLSACDSSEAAGLAETLVRGGVHRVLGMQSTVSDPGASAFAGAFYAALAQGTDLPAALRAGRVELAAKSEEHGEAHEWAIPTLTLSRDAGPLVAPQASAAPAPPPAEVIRKDFSIEGVTYLEKGYVGRRDVERLLLRAFQRGERVIVIHGLGGIGKSTLAARFLERRREEGARLLIHYAGKELSPASFLEEIAKKVSVERSGTLPPDAAEQQFQSDLQKALREVVPTILLLDNFEDNQDRDGHLRNPILGEALADLLQLGGPGFRFLLTSRLPVELPDPFEPLNCDLGELSPSGCRKLRLLDSEGLGSLEEDAWRQVLIHLGGHPKALELLGGYLKGKSDRARTLLANFDEAVETVDRKLSAKRHERGRSLLVETVLAEVPEERLPTFDRLCLLEEPVPSEELETLLAGDGIPRPAADLAWLRDHGLLARKVAPSALSGGDAVHRLLASRRQNALAEREGKEEARSWHLHIAEYLVQPGRPLYDLGIAARHRDAAEDRAGALNLYKLWVLQLRDRNAYVACTQIAREGLQRFPPGEFEEEKAASASLLNMIHENSVTLGLTEDSNVALESSLALLEDCDSPEACFQRAWAQILRGRVLIQRGNPYEAEKELLTAATYMEAAGRKRQHAVALNDIARLRAQAGDVAGVLKLYEEILDILEKLGEVRDRAVVQGDIARLLPHAENVAEVLKLHEERLDIFEQLGDVRSRALTLGDIAHLRAQAGNLAGALKLHEERLNIFEQLGDVRERALTLCDIARLRAQVGDVAEARRLQSERLEVHRQQGELDGIANTLYDLARLDLAEKKLGDATLRLTESWALLNKTGGG
jgi:tetratricopeptide (TPR) repeat protein